MTGTWTGYYKFNNQQIQKAIGFEKTWFTIIIKSFDGRQFEGTVTDDMASGGMEGTGVITGEIDAETISFQKNMPKAQFIYPSGERKSVEKKHPTLYYTGKFSKDKREANGEWKFKIRVGFLFGFIPVPYRPAKGTWSMTLQ